MKTLKRLKEKALALLEKLAVRLEPLKRLFGKATMVCGIGMVLVGFPVQIYANWKAQECGINPMIIGFATLLYVPRIPYQIAERAWWLIPADTMGLTACIILIFQYFMY